MSVALRHGDGCGIVLDVLVKEHHYSGAPKDFLFFMPHERYSFYLARLQPSRSEQPLQESLQESLQQLPFPFFLK